MLIYSNVSVNILCIYKLLVFFYVFLTREMGRENSDTLLSVTEVRGDQMSQGIR